MSNEIKDLYQNMKIIISFVAVLAKWMKNKPPINYIDRLCRMSVWPFYNQFGLSLACMKQIVC